MKKLDDVDFESQPAIKSFLNQYTCPYHHVKNVEHILDIEAWQVYEFVEPASSVEELHKLRGHDLHIVCNCGFASAKIFEPIGENRKKEAIEVFLNGTLFLGC